MSTFDQQITDAVADGRMSEGDAEVVHEFAAFLDKVGAPSDKSPEAIRRRRRALIEHADLCGLTDADVERLRAAEERDQ